MKFKFKTTQIGDATITHLYEHNPEELLAALNTASTVNFPTAYPPLTSHNLGGRLISVRRYVKHPQKGDFVPNEHAHHPSKVFSELLRSIKLKTAFSEVPIALIQKPSEFQLVTQWKVPTSQVMRLDDYLTDHNFSFQDKSKVCLSAIRKLAKMHAAQITHGHAHVRNVIVDIERKTAHFIDPTLLKKGTINGQLARQDFAKLYDQINKYLHGLKGLKILRAKLRQTYSQTKTKYLQRIKTIKQQNR